VKPLRSRDDFDEAAIAGSVIVVTDSSTGNRIHCPPCPWVKAAYFEAKVIRGNGKNGGYFSFSTMADAVASYGNVLCPRCAAGAAAGRRSTERATRRELPGPASGATRDGSEFRVKRADENAGVVEAWSLDRLTWRPTDWRENFRAALKDAVAELVADDSGLLVAAYTSPVTGTFDVENVLFFDLERDWNAGADCFERCASSAVIFEHSFDEPPVSPNGAPFLHHHRYEIARKDSPARLWANRRSLAKWKGVRCGPPSSWERAADVWRRVRQAPLDSVAMPGISPKAFGVSLSFSGPPGDLNLLRVVKAALDGVILSFQVDNGRSEKAGIEKFARRAGLDVDEATRLLRDGSRAVLGGGFLVWKSGQASPSDDRCVSVELSRGPTSKEWELSGEVYEAEKRNG
jgi:hypothetical protein